MIAIDCGYKDITKLLLQHKQLDVNEKALNGHTPLSEYIFCGTLEKIFSNKPVKTFFFLD